MNRLISAEWYRARKSAHALRGTFLLIIFFVGMGFFDTYSYVDDITVIKGFGDFFGMFSAMNIYVTIAVGCIFAFSYENKLLHFDMMAGNKISHIILSKVIVLAPIITLFSTVCIAIASAIVASKIGIGDMSIFVSDLLLFTCIDFRVIVSSILIMTIFKGALGVGIIFVRFTGFDLFFAFIVSLLSDGSEIFRKILMTFTSVEYSCLNGTKLAFCDVVITVFSTIVEILVLYVLSYISHKKKAFY